MCRSKCWQQLWTDTKLTEKQTLLQEVPTEAMSANFTLVRRTS